MRQTQIAWVMAQLKKKRVVTPMVAFVEIGCTRLAAVIYELRERGWAITTTSKNSGNGSMYAEYRLVAKPPVKG